MNLSYVPLRFQTSGLTFTNEQNKTVKEFYQQRVSFVSLGLPVAYKFGKERRSSFWYFTIAPQYNQLVKNVAAVRDSSGNTSESKNDFGLIYQDESQLSYSLALGYQWKLNDKFRKSGWALVFKGFYRHFFFLHSAQS